MAHPDIPTSYPNGGYHCELIEQTTINDDNIAAIYRQYGTPDLYEVIRWQWKPETYNKFFKKTIPAHWHFPKEKDEWGTNAWTCAGIERAKTRYEALIKRVTSIYTDPTYGKTVTEPCLDNPQ